MNKPARTTTPTTATGVYVNLPVKDLPKSIEFFTRLGFAFDARFTDASATCLVLGDNFAAMLLAEDKFRGFAPNPIADARRSTEVLVALALASRQQVDALVAAAVAAGGTTYKAAEDHGFMYGHGFQDLDGHVWELFHMDIAAFEQAQRGG